MTLLMPPHVRRLTAADCQRMVASGVLREGEPYELLRGQLVLKDRSAPGEDPMTIHPAHALAVKMLAKLSRRSERLGCHVQTQQPIDLGIHDHPEPDGAVVRGVEGDYADRHPAAADVPCVIEVASASLEVDRQAKQEIYADAGVGQYVIVNLRDGVVEVYGEPLEGKGRYGRVETLRGKQSVLLSAGAGKGVKVGVRTLLPV